MKANKLPHPETTASGNPAHPNNITNKESVSTPVRENRVEVWGLRIFYQSAGDTGPPVLLIHGGGSDFSGFAWKYTVGALAENHRVFAVDLPGYGESQAPDLRISDLGSRLARDAGKAALRILDWGGDLKEARKLVCKKGRINPFWFHIHFIKAFLDALGLERVNLAGISMGGGISIGVALEHPEYVEKLVLVSSYGLGDKIPRLPGMYLFSRIPFLYDLLRRRLHRSRKLVALGMGQLVYSPAALDEEMIDDAWRTVKKAGMHRTWQAFQKCEILTTRFRTDFTNLLPEISAPTLLIHGDHDELIPLQWSKKAHALIPDSQLHVFKDCGHLPPREKPEKFVRVVSNFLM